MTVSSFRLTPITVLRTSAFQLLAFLAVGVIGGCTNASKTEVVTEEVLQSFDQIPTVVKEGIAENQHIWVIEGFNLTSTEKQLRPQRDALYIVLQDNKVSAFVMKSDNNNWRLPTEKALITASRSLPGKHSFSHSGSIDGVTTTESIGKQLSMTSVELEFLQSSPDLVSNNLATTINKKITLNLRWKPGSNEGTWSASEHKAIKQTRFGKVLPEKQLNFTTSGVAVRLSGQDAGPTVPAATASDKDVPAKDTNSEQVATKPPKDNVPTSATEEPRTASTQNKHGSSIFDPKPQTGKWTLVPNGDFEDGMTNWSSMFSDANPGLFVQSKDKSFTGSRCTVSTPHRNLNGAGFAWISKPIDVIVGQEYVLSAAVNPSSMTTGELYVDIWKSDLQIKVGERSNKRGWTFVWTTYTPKTSPIQIRLVRDGDSNSAEPGFIDCVGLTPASVFVPPTSR